MFFAPADRPEQPGAGIIELRNIVIQKFRMI
jgi:hypothetical protein